MDDQLLNALQIRYIKLHFTISFIEDAALPVHKVSRFAEEWAKCSYGRIVSGIANAIAVILNQNVLYGGRCIQNPL